MLLAVKYVSLASILTLCLSVDNNYGERVTVCRTYNPEESGPPKCEGETVTIVKSSSEHGGNKPLDECKKEQIQQITEQVIDEHMENLTTRLNRLSEKIEQATNRIPATTTSHATSKAQYTKEITTAGSLLTTLQEQTTEPLTLNSNIEASTALTATTVPLVNGFARLDDGWIGLSNGYQYRIPSANANYESSRELCKDIGADLAVYGVRNMENRRIMRNALNLSDSMWIGMTDIDVEGTWKWINGELVADANVFWSSGEPNNNDGNREDCGFIGLGTLLNYDNPCSFFYRALCEKQSS